MKYADLQTTIEDSRPNDWVVAIKHGPTFLDQWATSSGPNSAVTNLHVDGHSSTAVLRDDIDISLAWGMESDMLGSIGDRRSLSFDWAKNNPDSSVYGYFADVLYRGVVVRRDWILSVDGGRAYLPLGRTRRKPGAKMMSRSADDYYDSATPSAVALARLIDGIEGNGDFGRYLSASGFVIEEDGDE